MKRPKTKPTKDCDHLNIGQSLINGKETTVCKDCMKPVDTAEFEPKAEPSEELLPFLKNGKDLVKVVEYKVDGIVQIPKLQPFFPVFECKPGDVLVVYRPKA